MNKSSSFVLSIDFELFWGLIDIKKINEYSENIKKVNEVIPMILKLLNKYQISCTWATVGSIMLNNYDDWISFIKKNSSGHYFLNNKNKLDKIKENQVLFFNPNLIKQILNEEGQEIGSHTFSHIILNEKKNNLHEFEDDLILNLKITKEQKIDLKSIVFPQNIFNKELLNIVEKHGIKSFRGNKKSFLYKNGDRISFGNFGRFLRFLDSSISISGNNIFISEINNKLIDIKASMFLRNYQSLKKFNLINLHLERIQKQMYLAATSNKNFHLWFHPHNFGLNPSENIFLLTKIFEYFNILNKGYGMISKNMSNFSN